MTNNRKKGIRIAGALFIILLCALGYWTYRCLNPTREQVQAAKARIEAYSCYEIRRNGKTMLRFDEDTTTLAATFMNRWALVPSCQGRLAASNNTDITRNRYQGLDADSVAGRERRFTRQSLQGFEMERKRTGILYPLPQRNGSGIQPNLRL